MSKTMSHAFAKGASRRDFLTAGLAGAAAGAFGLGPAARAQKRAPGVGASRGAVAKNLIFLVSDGMSVGTLTLTDILLRQRLNRRPWWIELMNRDDARTTLMETAPTDGLVTDSAAAASAWGVGRRVNSRAVCVTPEGDEPAPLFLRAKQAGKRIGLVTTTRLTDATPAGFIANAPRREMEAIIAAQLMERRVDVLLGGGGRFFTDELLSARQEAMIARDRAGLVASWSVDPAHPLIGLFADDKMRYELDRPKHEPSLAEMTSAALHRLKGASNGFALMIEGARVDHGAHANDAGGLIYDQWAFDDALKIALDFADEDGETLLIVATDHGNANPGLAGYKEAGLRAFERVQRLKRSFEWIFSGFEALPASARTGAALRHIVQEATTVELTDAELRLVLRWIDGERIDPYNRANGTSAVLGSVLANHIGVAFTGPDHTSDQVLATAVGPGSERLAPVIGLETLHGVSVAALDLPPISAATRR